MGPRERVTGTLRGLVRDSSLQDSWPRTRQTEWCSRRNQIKTRYPKELASTDNTVTFSPYLAYSGVEPVRRLVPYIQISIPPVVGLRPEFVPSITAFSPSIGSSTVAGGAEIPTGRNKPACGGGNARSWALAGGTVGLFGVRCLKRCRDLQTIQMRADPDWRAYRDRESQVWQGRSGG